MKRIYSLIAVALTLLTAVSCVQEIVKEDQLHDAAVVYKAIADGADTRAVLGTNEAGRPQSMWENGDVIHIHIENSTSYRFSTSLSEPSAVADFVYQGTDEFQIQAGQAVIATYPDPDWADLYYRYALVWIPSTQQSNPEKESYDKKALPVVAYSTDKTLHFKNAASLLKCQVNQASATRIRFYGLNDEVVAGRALAAMKENGEMDYVGIPEDEWNEHSVELSDASGGALRSSWNYYISIIPNTFASGFGIELLNAEGEVVFTKKYNKSITINRNTILDLGTLGEGSDQTYSDKLYVVGTYNDWRHEYSTYLYDYSGDNATYEGVIDFNSFGLWTGIENNEFKLTGGDWGIDEHSQSEGDHYGTEPDVLSLVEGAGANINAYQEKRFYHFTFDRASNTLKKNYAFNSVGVIGSFSGWSQDVDMNYNPETQKFWVDIEFAEDSELRFRLDDSWDVSFGADDSVTRAGNENIPVSTGQYRVYLNLNNSAEVNYEFNKEAYGTEENAGGVTPWEEPDPVEGWALIGEFNSWNGDELMTETEPGLWVITGFALEAGQQWKLRKDGSWDENYGGPGSVEPYNITLGETFTATYYGKNMAVSTSGDYDIYFDASKETILVLEAGSPLPEPTYLDYVDEYGISHGPGIEIDGVVWAPVNCGYHAENFKYGKLYQWGRKYGQGYVSSGDQTYSDSIFPEIIQGSVDLCVGQSEENAGRFYCQTPSIDDWCTTFDASLWNVGTDEVPVKTEYDPCPDGWRVPTFSELTALTANYSFWTTADGQEGRWFSGSASYTSEAPQIFFPASGSRDKEDGHCVNRNFSGTYWASRTGVTLGVWNNTVFVASTSCAYGSSVRCVKDDSELISVETVTLGMTELTLEGGETYTLTASITPSTANHKNAHWYSDNSAIVSVDQNGQLTAKSSGTTTITAMAGMQTAKCRVTVISTVPSESDYVDEYGINHGPGVVINGVVWAPVNCGYHETDYKWGKLYQWGRKFGQGYDGPATIEEGGVCVVTGNHKSNADVFYTGFDWVDVQDDKLWNLGSESDPMKTEYDPCPEGWRVPTHKELNVLSQNRSSWISENGLSGCWFSGASSYTETVPQVFLPAAGQRNNEGNADFRGDYGKYWSSQINGFYADKLSFSSGTTNMSFRNRAYGYSVRCVQDDSELIAVENVTLDKTELSLEEGETYTLTASITPSTANHKSAYWYSDNTSVAVVDQNGKVTAVAPGKAVVTAVAGMTAAVCEFTVNAKPVEETKEVTLWQGAALVDDWIADPTVFVLSDGGEELLQAGAKPGQVLYFYVEVLDTFWNLDIYEGHWSKVYLSLDFSSYDIDANGGKIGLTLTDEILATACSPQYWGGSFLLLGDNIKVTKITLL